MTRKCVLCKETNYKNSFSFFSAPKDPEARRKWQEAIAIDNYTVSDDTYVCSRHFLPSDVITHWVSGVPPHVVTIKYKKCRLRPGAIPTTSSDVMNNVQNYREEDLDDDFDLYRSWRIDNKTANFTENRGEVFQIPRNDKILTYTSVDNHNSLKSTAKNETDIEDYPVIVPTEVLQEQNSEMIIDNDSQHHVMNIIQEDKVNKSSNTIYLKSNNSQILYIEAIDDNCKTNCVEEEIDYAHDTKERIGGFFLEKSDTSPYEEGEELEVDDDGKEEEDGKNEENEEESRGMWKTVDTKKNSVLTEIEEKPPIDLQSSPMEASDPLELNEGTMLFEDFLDIFTDVSLPQGWSTMVISKGRDTTVIYASMNTTKTGMPYVEKQVFLKSDMNLKCSAAGREINPKLHNLIREGRRMEVHSLSDVEDIIEEFDIRIVCEGSLEEINPADLDSTMAYRDSFKWRHKSCPIIVNNGSSRCSKCSTLSLSAVRRKLKRPPQTAESAELLKKERTIFVLQQSLSKMSKRNKKYELMKGSIEDKLKHISSKSSEDILDSLDWLSIPKIQKVMIKECLKVSKSDDHSEFSESWIFLSLLLYIESPRIYKYLKENQFMSLPGIKIMKRYLNQIKNDTQFYTLFQKSVEPFQVADRESEETA